MCSDSDCFVAGHSGTSRTHAPPKSPEEHIAELSGVPGAERYSAFRSRFASEFATRFLRLCFQIPQQSLERFKVGVVVLPVPEVTNVPCPPNVCCPGLVRFHDHIIDADRQ